MNRSIRHKFFYPHPPEVVWDYLTKSELIAQWLMPNDFQPIVGFDFQFKVKPMPDFNFDGVLYCKVLVVVPFKKLSYSWKGGPGDGRLTLDTIVEWKLQPKDNGTELLLDHSGFMEDVNLYSLMDQGWLKNMQKITELVNKAKHGSTSA